MPIDDRLQPKDSIPDSARTDGRDKAFQQLEELRAEGELVGKSYGELEELTGWSRPHLRNVIEGYYVIPEGKDEESSKDNDGSGGVGGKRVVIWVPEGVDRESFLRGWVDGYLGGEGAVQDFNDSDSEGGKD